MTREDDADRLAAAALAKGDPTGWFEQLYAQAADGAAVIPWDRPAPSGGLATAALPPGEGRRALVVGCGLGRDAEYVAALGYTTTAFDIAQTAVRGARERHRGSAVDYRVADLLAPPAAWAGAFDLVVESNNVQALPRDLRPGVTATIAGFVAAGGTLLVLAAKVRDRDGGGPPWPLTRDEIDAFAGPPGGLRAVTVEELGDNPVEVRWRATFTR
jgi:SAM-dependent methyltransferase